jgi:hypothetical protein
MYLFFTIQNKIAFERAVVDIYCDNQKMKKKMV